MVTQRLRHAAETFAAHRDDGLADFGRLFLGDGFNVVTDQADRAFRLHRDAFGQGKEAFQFVDQLGELLVAAEHDVFLLKVGREVDVAERIHPGRAGEVVAAATARVGATAHGTVRDVDDVLDRTPHHALGAGVGATALGHDARHGFAIGGDALLGLFDGLVIHHQVLGTVLLGLLGINLQHLFDEGLGLLAGELRHLILLCTGL